MEKRRYEFPSCTRTAGRPFEDGPRCPIYLKTHEFLRSNGWGQLYYNSFKTGTGDICNTKYERMEKSDGKDLNVLSMLEVNIEGTSRTCQLRAVLWTYHPKNVIKTIDHECETDIITGLDNLLVKHTLNYKSPDD